jgi:RND family efflux transporter MFP subunit
MRRKTLMLNSMLALGAVAIVGFGITSLGAEGSETPTETLTEVQTGTVAQTVSATGNAVTPQDLTLNFSAGGELVELGVAVGDTVTQGQVLAKVDSSAAENELRTAQANLASAQARLQGILDPLTAQDEIKNQASVDQAQVAVDTAQTNLDNARATLAQDTITQQNAVDKARQALGNSQAVVGTGQNSQQSSLDQARQSLTDAVAQLPVGVIVSAASGDSAYAEASSLVATYKRDQQLCDAVSNGGTHVLPDGLTCADVPGHLGAAQEVLTAARALVTAEDQVASSDAQSKQTLDNATNAVTDALQTQTVTLAKDQQAIVSAQRQLESAQASYRSTVASNAAAAAPASASDVTQQQASVVTAQVGVENAQKAVADTVLVAPAAGTITVVNASVGETVAAGGDGFITLVSTDSLQVKAGFSETDAAKIEVGQTAIVTFDALADEPVTGTVVAVDATATVTGNVVTYNVTVALESTSPSVKVGMTASVDVTVAERTGVLVLPSTAVTGRGDTAIVTVRPEVEGQPDEQRTVTVGLRGDENVEIVSGLEVGDVVVTEASEAVSSGLGGAGFTQGGPIGGGGGGPAVFVGP